MVSSYGAQHNKTSLRVDCFNRRSLSGSILTNFRVWHMKNIFLLRHAHAANSQDNDFDRSLSEAGILKCHDIANILKEYILDIDLILSSPAIRTRQTIENILSDLQINKQVNYDNELYEASVNSLFQQFSSLEDNHKNILIVSHNPAISELGRFLAKNSIVSPHALEVLQGFSPGSLALYSANIEFWKRLDPSNVLIKEFWR